jgi:hypothetical protein
MRVQWQAVQEGHQHMLGIAAGAGGSGGAAAPGNLGDQAQAGRLSSATVEEDGAAGGAYDHDDVLTLDGAPPEVDDDPLSLLNAQQFEEPPAVAGALPADGGGPTEAETAAAVDQFMELIAALGISDAMDHAEKELGPAMVTAVMAQLWQDAAAVLQLGDAEPDWEGDGREAPGNDQPGSAAFYRARLAQALYPGAEITLLQYITWLLRLREAHTMRDQCVDELCRMHHEKVLPKGNILPPSLFLLLKVRVCDNISIFALGCP